MDPLSITTGSLALADSVGKAAIALTAFIRDVRDARSDIDAVSAELNSLNTILDLLVEDVQTATGPMPPILETRIVGVLSNCSHVVEEIQTCVKKHQGSRIQKGMRWVAVGKGDMEKLRSTLEAHKATLNLALDMISITTLQEVRDTTHDIKIDTREIHHTTEDIKEDTARILEAIAELQARLPPDDAPRFDMLQRYLDELTTYAESVIDGGSIKDFDSDRASADDVDSEPEVADTTNTLVRPHVQGQHADAPPVPGHYPCESDRDHISQGFEISEEGAITKSNAEKRQSTSSTKRLSFAEFTKRLSSTSSLLLVQTNASGGSSRGSSEIDTQPSSIPRGTLNPRGTGPPPRDRDGRCGWRNSVGVLGNEGGFLSTLRDEDEVPRQSPGHAPGEYNGDPILEGPDAPKTLRDEKQETRTGASRAPEGGSSNAPVMRKQVTRLENASPIIPHETPFLHHETRPPYPRPYSAPNVPSKSPNSPEKAAELDRRKNNGTRPWPYSRQYPTSSVPNGWHKEKLKGTTLYPFIAKDEGELTVQEGQDIILLEPDGGDGWVKVRAGFEEGVIPSTYIKWSSERPTFTPSLSSTNVTLISSSATPSTAASKKGLTTPTQGAQKFRYVEALYEFTAQDDTEHSIFQGQRFMLIKDDPGDGWVDIEKEGIIASVPACYVQDI